MSTLIDEIKRLQDDSSVLEPSSHQLKSMYQSLADNSVCFLGELNKLDIFSDNKSVELNLDRDSDVEGVIGSLFQEFSKSGLQAASKGHLAYIPGGGLSVGALADAVAATINQFSADSNASPVSAKINEQTIRWLCDAMGYPKTAHGDITSGGSLATLTALSVAKRHKNLGVHNQADAVIYMSEHTHHCVDKAIAIVFGEDVIIRHVKLDESMKLDLRDLEKKIGEDALAGKTPFMIVANAGTTNLGKVDPLDVLADLAVKYDVWLHVDGAYGGFFNTGHTKSLFKGIERADSIVLDPHKTMFLPYGSGAVLLKNGNLLEQTFSSQASYLQDSQRDCAVSPMDNSIELSRPFRSLRVWLAIKIYGKEVLAASLAEKIYLQYMCEKLEAIPQVSIFTKPDLSIVSFKLDSDRSSKQLLDLINSHQKFHLSSTTIDGSFIIRVAIVSFRTHKEHIDELFEIIQTSVKETYGDVNDG